MTIDNKRSANEGATTTTTAAEQPSKKQDLSFKTLDKDVNYSQFLNQEIFQDKAKSQLQQQISDATPYKWGSIHNLVDDTLLRNVRDEILNEIHFTKKETDIYKVFQSGDLRNLNGLDNQELGRLPNLLKLRNALYCPQFRDLISYVTQAGKISANKYDMSLNIYHKSCHLLTHDDVIGSRRVSFILYLPDPDKKWKEHYGGALRLFGAHFSNVPKTDYQKKFVPNFNDYAFFEVKPGYSFHDVEEVKADKQRISIQGWFHIPQEGEDGYIPGELEKFEQQSSLQQLESGEVQQFDYPKLNRDAISNENREKLRKDLQILESEEERSSQSKTDSNSGKFQLNDNDKTELLKYLNPKLLTSNELSRLNSQFLNESMISITDFLNDDFSSTLKKHIKQTELTTEVPKLSKDVKLPWKVAMPCVKHRFLYIDGKRLEPELASLQYEHEPQDAKQNRQEKQHQDDAILQESDLPDFETVKKDAESRAAALINNKDKKEKSDKDDEDDEENSKGDNEAVAKLAELAVFLKSTSFKKFLLLVASVVPISEQVLIRRFRPGQDFTLATNQDTKFSAGKQGDAADVDALFERIDAVLEGTLCLTPSQGWDSGEVGGYELCMAMDENDDPAIYRNTGSDDSVLLNSQASWNSFNLILRDSSILKFIKYVSFGAKGSRWDVNCQWDVEGLKDDGSESEEDDEEEGEEEK